MFVNFWSIIYKMHKLILKKLLFNSEGSSLVQVMIISGMVSVFGLAVMQTQKNVKSVQRSLLIRESNNELKTAVTALLKYPDVCVKNFVFFTKSIADPLFSPTSFIDLPDAPPNGAQLTDFNDIAVYREHNNDSSITYFGKSRIKDMKIGHYVTAKSLATLRLTLDNIGPGGNRLLHLGGELINLDIPIRIFYDGAGAVKRCMAEEVPIDVAYTSAASETQLAQLCTNDLGGQFLNGDCQIPEFTEESSKSRNQDNATSPDNFCQNFGGEYIPDPGPNAGICTGLLSGSKTICPVPGEVAKGFTTGGALLCGPP